MLEHDLFWDFLLHVNNNYDILITTKHNTPIMHKYVQLKQEYFIKTNACYRRFCVMLYVYSEVLNCKNKLPKIENWTQSKYESMISKTCR